MNSTSKILAALSLIWSSAWAEGPVRIDGAEFDFGQVVTNSTVAHTVWIHAAGSDTLTLTDVKTGCGCITSPWSAGTILPGDSLSLIFYWQTRGSLGDRKFSAYLFLEADGFPEEVILSGKVVTPDNAEASLDWRPAILRPAGNPGGDLNVSFELTNRTGEKLTSKVVEASPGLTVEAPDTIESDKPAVGRVRLETREAVAAFEGSMTLELSGNQVEVFRVSIPVQYGDFSFRPFFTTKQK